MLRGTIFCFEETYSATKVSRLILREPCFCRVQRETKRTTDACFFFCLGGLLSALYELFKAKEQNVGGLSGLQFAHLKHGFFHMHNVRISVCVSIFQGPCSLPRDVGQAGANRSPLRPGHTGRSAGLELKHGTKPTPFSKYPRLLEYFWKTSW